MSYPLSPTTGPLAASEAAGVFLVLDDGRCVRVVHAASHGDQTLITAETSRGARMQVTVDPARAVHAGQAAVVAHIRSRLDDQEAIERSNRRSRAARRGSVTDWAAAQRPGPETERLRAELERDRLHHFAVVARLLRSGG